MPRKFSMDEPLELPEMDYSTISTNHDAAGMFVHYLLEAATRMVQSRQWTVEDLLAIVRYSQEGGETPIAFLEGRVFRRRLEEAIERAERYGENFSVMVVNMGDDSLSADLYPSVLDGLMERLRRSDQVFLFPNKAAILLPYTGGKDLGNLSSRLSGLVEAVLGPEATITIEDAAFPSQIGTPSAMMDWAEQRVGSQ